MKTCRKCINEKAETEFYERRIGSGVLYSHCKDCYKSEASEHRAKHKEKINAQRAEYRARNKDRIRARGAKRYAENRDKIRAQQDKYKEKNPDKYKEKDRNRRAALRGAEGKHSAADIMKIFERQRGLCAGCNARLFKSGANRYHVDHIVPLAKGGSNWPDNVQCLCPTCNLSKGAKLPEEWAAQNGRLF